MQRKTSERATVSFALIVLAVTAFILIVTGCTTSPYDKDYEHGVRLSVGAGQGTVRGEHKESSETARGDGNVYALRLEWNQQPADFENVKVGLRGQVGMQDNVQATGFGQGGTGTFDLEAQHAEIHGVVRGYVPITGGIRPFAEVYGGFGYYTGDLTASGGGLATPRHGDDEDFAPVGGAGLGVEFDVGDRGLLFIQGDYSIRLPEMDVLELRAENIMLFAGGEFRF